MLSLELENKNIDPLKAMGIFDKNKRGQISGNDFKRAIRTLTPIEESDLEFLVKLADKNVDQTINYRHFCAYLDKKTIRNFKRNDLVNSILDQ